MLGFDLPPRADPASSDRLTATWTPFTETCKTFDVARGLYERDFPAGEQSGDDAAFWSAFQSRFSGPR